MVWIVEKQKNWSKFVKMNKGNTTQQHSRKFKLSQISTNFNFKFKMAFTNFSIQDLFTELKMQEKTFRKENKKSWTQFVRNVTFAEAIVSVLARKNMLSVDVEEALELLAIPSAEE